MRWRIAVLVSAAIAISYLDRQTLPVAVNAIARDIPLSNQQFSALQSAFLLRLCVHVCWRRKAGRRARNAPWIYRHHDFLVAGQCEPRSGDEFCNACGEPFLLGMGEGGGFPAATRAVAEWFPTNERATAMGIINAGTAVGAVIAPPADCCHLEFLQLAMDIRDLGRNRVCFGPPGGGCRMFLRSRGLRRMTRKVASQQRIFAGLICCAFARPGDWWRRNS